MGICERCWRAASERAANKGTVAAEEYAILYPESHITSKDHALRTRLSSLVDRAHQQGRQFVGVWEVSNLLRGYRTDKLHESDAQ